MTSQVHYKFLTREEARDAVDAVRALLAALNNFRNREVYATVRQTKERTTRNCCLLRAAAALRGFSKLAAVQPKSDFDLVCWGSAKVCLDRRVVQVKEPNNKFEWAAGWYSGVVYNDTEDNIRAAVENIE